MIVKGLQDTQAQETAHLALLLRAGRQDRRLMADAQDRIVAAGWRVNGAVIFLKSAEPVLVAECHAAIERYEEACADIGKVASEGEAIVHKATDRIEDEKESALTSTVERAVKKRRVATKAIAQEKLIDTERRMAEHVAQEEGETLEASRDLRDE